MHPSSARRYSNLCHLQTLHPFLSFPSISEPGCQLAGQKPISQSSFLPLSWERACLAVLLPGWTPGQTPSQGWHPGLPRPAVPGPKGEGGEGSSILQGLPGPAPASWGALNGYQRSQHLPMWVHINLSNSKTIKAAVF